MDSFPTSKSPTQKDFSATRYQKNSIGIWTVDAWSHVCLTFVFAHTLRPETHRTEHSTGFLPAGVYTAEKNPQIFTIILSTNLSWSKCHNILCTTLILFPSTNFGALSYLHKCLLPGTTVGFWKRVGEAICGIWDHFKHKQTLSQTSHQSHNYFLWRVVRKGQKTRSCEQNDALTATMKKF